MEYFIAVLHTNREDLLRNVLDNLRDYIDNVVVIDNSEHALDPEEIGGAQLFRPTVPLSYAQTLNFLAGKAKAFDLPFFFTSHEDAVYTGNKFEQLLQIARQRQNDPDFGVLLTNEDALAGYNTKLFDLVKFDVNLPMYYTDTDFFYWTGQAGFKVEQTPVRVVHLRSQTIRSDEKKNFINNITFPLYAEYYQRKTGGPKGRETFKIPFNCPLFKP